LVYRSSGPIEEAGITPTATRWFRDTGEFWGVATSFFSEHGGSYTLATGYAVERWADWLERTVNLSASLGGAGPFHIELGLDGIQGTLWPRRGFGRDTEVEALEDSVRHDALLIDTSQAAISALVEATFGKVTLAYGMRAPSNEEFQTLLRGR
jgi:hypothetical protein